MTVTTSRGNVRTRAGATEIRTRWSARFGIGRALLAHGLRSCPKVVMESLARGIGGMRNMDGARAPGEPHSPNVQGVDGPEQVAWPEKLRFSNKRLDHLIIVVHGIGDMLDSKSLATNVSNLCMSLQTACTLCNFPMSLLVRAVEWHSKMQERWRRLLHRAVPGYPNAPESAVRRALQDYVGDVVLFGSEPWREMLIEEVARQIECEFEMVKRAYPRFSGRCSLFCHSLGGVIGFELFRRGRLPPSITIDNVFCVGSPVAAYLSLEADGLAKLREIIVSRDPKYPRFYNVYHALDPTAFRWEPFLLWDDKLPLPRAVQIWVTKNPGPFHFVSKWVHIQFAKLFIDEGEEHVHALPDSRGTLFLDRVTTGTQYQPENFWDSLLLPKAFLSYMKSIPFVQNLWHKPQKQKADGRKDRAEEGGVDQGGSLRGSISALAHINAQPDLVRRKSASELDDIASSFVDHAFSPLPSARSRSRRLSAMNKTHYRVTSKADERMSTVGQALDLMEGRRFDFQIRPVSERPILEQVLHWHTLGAHFTYWTSVDVSSFMLTRIARHQGHSIAFREIRIVDPSDRLGYYELCHEHFNTLGAELLVFLHCLPDRLQRGLGVCRPCRDQQRHEGLSGGLRNHQICLSLHWISVQCVRRLVLNWFKPNPRLLPVRKERARPPVAAQLSSRRFLAEGEGLDQRWQ
ncbi:putative phospholipase, mitochondrial [Porphyridium purpureum]|uniref:Putative phospholipase, mitochondrial n=1 Tax=Porphyridium purpureum TaxID=35688 RepID=A0A5J4YKN0_PORPP|nr:putative phospholipase, mitochondrial [Porphyridium purpureum]|eukprot:POR7113..scf297_16